MNQLKSINNLLRPLAVIASLLYCAVRAAGASTRATLLAPPPESGEFLGATVW